MVRTTVLMASRTSMVWSHLLGEPRALRLPWGAQREAVHKFTSGGALRVAVKERVNKGARAASSGAPGVAHQPRARTGLLRRPVDTGGGGSVVRPPDELSSGP